MSILEKIVRAKRVEIEKCKIKFPVATLEKSKYFATESYSLEKALTEGTQSGIIAEFKRQSPSKGIINSSAVPEIVCPAYFNSGSSAVSVLTDSEFFGGCTDDLVKARKVSDGPLLRKEFIIDEYQVLESKSIGADAILLIADILSGEEMKKFSALAESLKLEVLYEIHDEYGIEKLPKEARLIGVNSRNLGNFNVNMNILDRTINMLPHNCIKIAESGINSEKTVMNLIEAGFTGFLIGELFMHKRDPGIACKEFITNLKNLKNLKKCK